MWDTVIDKRVAHMTHERPCTACGHNLELVLH